MRPFLALALLALPACSGEAQGAPGVGSGPQRSWAIAGFDAVDATGSDDVAVRTGAGFSVRAEGDPAVLDHLRVWREGDTLRIGRERNWVSDGGRSAKVFVTMPRIAAASVTGSASMDVDRVAGAFKGATTGSGDLTVRQVATDTLSLSLAGSGDMALVGRTRRLDVSVAGSGKLDAPSLVAAGAAVNVAGSGDVRTRVEGAASVSLLGSGSVDLGPRARCQVSKMGSGDVRCGG